MSFVDNYQGRDISEYPTTLKPVADLRKGDVIWLSRKVRGTFCRDIVAVLVSDAQVEGVHTYFDHVNTEMPNSGTWHACTSSDASYEVVIFND